MPATVYIDGIDVTNVTVSGSSTRRLNRPSVASIKLPMDSAIGSVGSLVKIEFNGTLHHHGRVLLCETDTGEDMGYTTYNSTDPLEMWQWRPVRDTNGNFSKPDLIQLYETGPRIIEEMIYASIEPSLIPGGAEGSLFLSMGSFATGGVSLLGAPVDWPMTMAQLASLLISTGELDIVLTPIDSGGDMAQIDCYNGDYGTDRSGSVVFQYGTGARNVRRVRWNRDMTNMVNKYWVYLGPKLDDQHWQANITGDDPGLANPPGGDVNPFVPGASPLGDRIQASRNAYGVRMKVDIFDATGFTTDAGGVIVEAKDLYRRLWQAYGWLAANPVDLVHVTPIRGTQIGTFDIGDLIGVEASAAVMGGFSGAQRVYEYTISWEAEGSVLELSEIQTSIQNEGF